MVDDPELLTGLSTGELEALADGLLTPSAHSRLHDLLGRKSAGTIADDELRELDALLERVDQLTILKARARYTLHAQKVGVGES